MRCGQPDRPTLPPLWSQWPRQAQDKEIARWENFAALLRKVGRDPTSAERLIAGLRKTQR